MHKVLREIPQRILDMALAALAQANTHAVFSDPGFEYRENMSVLNAALAGELMIKAIIAKEHPLLIFRDLFEIERVNDDELSLESLIKRGRTYNFEHLPKLLWVTTGDRIPNLDVFEQLRNARNAIQHFCVPEHPSLGSLSLEFIYKNVDPLLKKHFDLCAIEYHEDHVGYDYVVEALIHNELLFSIPSDFDVSEIDLEQTLSEAGQPYQAEVRNRIIASKNADD
ncbi:hypothetical protein [Microvirga sp. 2TAF3]|uniref:hypothetical protein n=1 Tax=Microvirga sp. 2TAF3 TaxID=3233014 RepID=UPI003F9DBA5C